MAISGNQEYLSPTLGDLASKFGAISRSSVSAVVIAIAVLTAVFVAFDMVVPAEDQLRLQSITNILSVVVDYVLMRQLLAASAPAGASPPASRVGGYIGLGIVTGLGAILGLLLLIVPGLILAARWMLAAPILLAHDTTVGEAISQSWNATAGSWGKLLVAQIVIAVPLIAGIGVAMIAVDANNMGASIVQNALLSLFSISAVVLSVSAYRTIVPESTGLADIFA